MGAGADTAAGDASSPDMRATLQRPGHKKKAAPEEEAA